MENLKKRREQGFPVGFQEKYYHESKIILKMTDQTPERRPSAKVFLDRSPEYQCWSFDLKMGLDIWGAAWPILHPGVSSAYLLCFCSFYNTLLITLLISILRL